MGLMSGFGGNKSVVHKFRSRRFEMDCVHVTPSDTVKKTDRNLNNKIIYNSL